MGHSMGQGGASVNEDLCVRSHAHFGLQVRIISHQHFRPADMLYIENPFDLLVMLLFLYSQTEIGHFLFLRTYHLQRALL